MAQDASSNSVRTIWFDHHFPWIATVLICVALAAYYYRLEQGMFLATDPTPSGFSTADAHDILTQVYGDEVPHPAGSANNDTVRQRIIDLVESWGYQVETQQTSATAKRWQSRDDQEIPLENILFRLDGSAPENLANSILVLSHYDSTPFGPGICDDGVGVAALLQVAKQLKQLPSHRNPIVFLITDGEEYGLLGASRFVAEHALAKDIQLVINLEARGSSGRSLMFETSPNNRWLVELMAKQVSNPATSSLFVEFYKRMPNDTDLTVFLNAQNQGYNFAFIGDGQNYHTPNDNLKNASQKSLAHHGDNLLALLKGLANRPIDVNPKGSAVYFDLFGKWLIWWPSEWTLWISIGGMAWAIIAIYVYNLRSPQQRNELLTYSNRNGFGFAMLACVISILGIALVSESLIWGITWEKALTATFPKSPFPVVGGLWCSSVAVCIGVASLFKVQVARQAQFCVLLWNALSIAVSAIAPGASYLFLIPAAVGSCGLLVSALCNNSRSHAWSVTFFGVVVGIFWLGLESLFYQAYGLKGLHLLTIRLALVSTAWLPIVATLRFKSAVNLALIFATSSVILLSSAVVLNRM